MNRIKEFGSAVRKRRLARGFTQEQLAELANLHVNSISFVERGLVPPALDTICLIADALGIKASDLVIDMENSASRPCLKNDLWPTSLTQINHWLFHPFGNESAVSQDCPDRSPFLVGSFSLFVPASVEKPMTGKVKLKMKMKLWRSLKTTTLAKMDELAEVLGVHLVTLFTLEYVDDHTVLGTRTLLGIVKEQLQEIPADL